jgi:signal transduction histidine kinase/CheY-like chemotaxis protein
MKFPFRPFLAGRGSLDLSEFQRMTLVWVLLIEGVATVLWQMFANHQLILLLALALHILALWLSSRSLALAGLAWGFCIAAVVVASVGAYQLPLASGLLSLLPLFGVLIFGFAAGIMAQGLVAALMLFMGERYAGLPGMAGFVAPVILAGLATLAIGSVFRYWFVDTIQVYYGNYLRANAGIEEARQQRLELKQVQEDLLHANRELARLTRQLKTANQAAEEARQAKETFVATVSHELRTPLNMIIGFSEVIAQSPQVYGGRLPATLLADIASIQRNSQHLLELVNDVLDLSQVDMGNLSIARARCSLRAIVEQAFEVIRPLFQSKGLYLEAGLPEQDLEFSCDQTRVREVIINLLSNAGRFTDQGGVRVNARQERDLLVVAVADTGPGIAPADQQRLFEPFQQLDSSIRRKHGGSGLGLTISKRFVELHGGKMWLESAPGAGTTFFFSLPILAPEPAPGDGEAVSEAARWINPFAVVEARQRPFKAPQGALVPRCVVLEEGDMARHLLTRYLEGVEIAPAGSPEEVFERLAESPAQLLVINHPRASDLLETICAGDRLPFGLPVIAFWLPGRADMATTLKVSEYLIKPVTQENLLGAIRRVPGPVERVLLVDDNPEVLQLFGRILSSAGQRYTVLRASDGQQALEMLRRRRPDLMVLDLIMPEMSGFRLLEEKAADERIRDIPVVVVSAQDPAGVQKIERQITLAREGGFPPRDLLDLLRSAGFARDLPRQAP